MNLPVGLLGVTETQALLPLETEGLRIPLDKDLLAEVDFRRPRESILEITIGWRGRLPTGTGPPRMAILPTAGNSIVVELPRGLPTLEVFPSSGGVPIPFTEFRVDWPGVGSVVILLQPGLRIRIEARLAALPAPNQPFTALSMVVRPNAANLVTVILREQPGAILIRDP